MNQIDAARTLPHPLRVEIFLFDGVTALDAVGPYEALSRLPQVEVVFSALTPGSVRTGNGFLGLLADHSIFDPAPSDVILFPGGDVSRIQALVADPRLLEAIRRRDRRSTYTASVCTGALFLGAAGLLEGQRAATHWRAQPLLSHYGAQYSGQRVTRTGKLLTSAGVSAGIELGLELCGLIAGPALGRAVELSLEYAPVAPYGGAEASAASAQLIEQVKTALR